MAEKKKKYLVKLVIRFTWKYGKTGYHFLSKEFCDSVIL